MTVRLVPRTRGDAFALDNLQVQLLAGVLLAVDAADRDLLAPGGYVPSHVCTAWSDALFPALQDLVLVETWDADRAQLRPVAVLRAPVSLERGQRRRRPEGPGPWAGLPLVHERTAVMETPFGALLLQLAAWLGTCGGCTVLPGLPTARP